MKPKAYSYIRFSTPDQLKGDSLRRQLEASQKYADDNGLELITEYQDLGVSAFRGSHANDGRLSAFIEAVKSGQIARGSYLLIESLDRLSREKVKTALARFIDLLDLGVNIVTLMDGKCYTEDADQIELMYSLMIMGRAHEESKTKSERVRKAWERKREEAQRTGKPLSSRCPAWIELVGGEYQIIEDRAEIVRQIFALTSEGVGAGSISKRFNSEGIPPWGRGKVWHSSYIEKILKSPAVYGEFQPRASRYNSEKGKSEFVPDGVPITDYYPSVLSKDDCFKALSVKAKPVTVGRKGSKFTNLFTGLVECSVCGSSMIIVDKGKRPKGAKYLVCSSKHTGSGCKAKNIRYIPFERATLAALLMVDHSSILPNEKINQREIAELEENKLSITGQLKSVEERKKRFVDAIAGGEAPSALVEALTKAEREEKELQDRLAAIESSLSEAESLIQESLEALDSLKKISLRVQYQLIQAQHEGSNDEVYVLREKLHKLYKRLIDKIQINGDSEEWRICFHSGEEASLYFLTERYTRTNKVDGKTINRPMILKKGFLCNPQGEDQETHELLEVELNKMIFQEAGFIDSSTTDLAELYDELSRKKLPVN